MPGEKPTTEKPVFYIIDAYPISNPFNPKNPPQKMRCAVVSLPEPKAKELQKIEADMSAIRKDYPAIIATSDKFHPAFTGPGPPPGGWENPPPEIQDQYDKLSERRHKILDNVPERRFEAKIPKNPLRAATYVPHDDVRIPENIRKPPQKRTRR